jgi:hypothetical protein
MNTKSPRKTWKTPVFQRLGGMEMTQEYSCDKSGPDADSRSYHCGFGGGGGAES